MISEIATSTGDWTKIPTGRGEVLEPKVDLEDGKFELWQLDVGDVLRVIGGEGDGQYIYDFCVRSADTEPTVTLKQTGPDGTVVHFEDYELILRGSGRWVGREWPLFRYGQGWTGDKQILIDYGTVHVGGDLVIIDPSRPYNDDKRMAYLQPSVTSLEIIRQPFTGAEGLS